MFRLTKRLEVLIDSGEYKRSPHLLLPSSSILTNWCPGLLILEPILFLNVTCWKIVCTHGGALPICAQSRNKTTLFRLVKTEKCDLCSKKSMCVFRRSQQKISATKSYWCYKFRLLKLQYQPVLWDKMTVKQNPRKNGSLRSRQMGRFRKWNYRFWEKGGTGNLYHGNLTAPWQREDKSAPVLVTASWYT